jgi:hypothetical protein
MLLVALSFAHFEISGAHLTDLVFIEDGNPDIKDGKINFKKRKMVYASMTTLERYQVSKFEFEVVEPLFTVCRLLPHVGEDILYNLSLIVEPRE